MKYLLTTRVLSLGLCALVLLSFPAKSWGESLKADFNGDGFADLAIGVPQESVGSIGNAGAVNVLYGSAAGLSATGNQFWHQFSPGIADAAEAFDQFGSALAAGDFNDDGFADLAVGVPTESVGAIEAAGAVHVLYGSQAGLTATGNQFWHQNRPGIADTAEVVDSFGGVLASGTSGAGSAAAVMSTGRSVAPLPQASQHGKAPDFEQTEELLESEQREQEPEQTEEPSP